MESPRRKALLLKPRYPYGKSQIYLPTGVYSVASRLQKSGIQSDVRDLDIDEMPSDRELFQYDSIGIGILGAPSIPDALQLARHVYDTTSKRSIIGGQTIQRMEAGQFEKIFGNYAVQASTDEATKRFFDARELQPLKDTKISDSLRNIDDAALRAYLSTEFSFFTSDGCIYNCGFCAATKNTREFYRSDEAMKEDAEFFARKAAEFGIPQMRIYCTSIDLFQSPENLGKVLDIFSAMREKYGIDFNIRGLSRLDSFSRALRKYPELETKMYMGGLRTIGFGFDGTSENIWRAQRKAQHMSDGEGALRKCKELGVTPEMLMVMGFPQDTWLTLLKNIAYSTKKAVTNGVVIRPYLAKSFVPGNEGWQLLSDKEYLASELEKAREVALKNSDNKKAREDLKKFEWFQRAYYEGGIETMLKNPELFKNIDYNAFGSKLTHPDTAQRYLANFAYAALMGIGELLGRNTTYPYMPRSQGKGKLSGLWNKAAEYVNRMMPADR